MEADSLDARYWCARFAELSRRHDTSKSKEKWDEKAARFSHKPKRSSYIDQLIALLDLQPGESVFDMGCGPGTASVPLARGGHHVVAVDFSTGMLAELDAAMEAANIAHGKDLGQIERYERAWQQDWADLPQADVALSSRSLITDDLADAVAKMEAHARKRVVIVIGAGQSPQHGLILPQMSHESTAAAQGCSEMSVLVNYLIAIGRFPQLRYIEYPYVWRASSVDELRECIVEAAGQVSEEQRRVLEDFVDGHVLYDEANCCYQLDYQQMNRWAYVEWQPRA